MPLDFLNRNKQQVTNKLNVPTFAFVSHEDNTVGLSECRTTRYDRRWFCRYIHFVDVSVTPLHNVLCFQINTLVFKEVNYCNSLLADV